MALVLSAHGTENPFAEAYVTKSITASADIYIQFEVLIESVVYAELDSATDDGQFAPMFVGFTGAGSVTTYFGDATGTPGVEPSTNMAPVGTLVDGAWMTLGVRLIANGAGSDPDGEVEIDGTQVFSGALTGTPNPTTFDEINLGVIDMNNAGGDADYTIYFKNLTVGTTGFGSSDLFSETFDDVGALGNFDATEGDVEIVEDPEPTPTPDTGRFLECYQWRFIVTDLDSATLTFLDRLETNRRVVAKLGAAWEHTGTVPSFSPEVNIIRSGSVFDPFVQEGISLVYGFRREAPGGSGVGPWVCRFGGILLDLEDDADTDFALSTLRAWDAWMYLYSRPVRDPDSGEIPGVMGLTLSDPLDEQAIALIETTIAADGPAFIDTLSGQLDPCDAVEQNYPQGMSVGEALDQIMATNACEIMFTPVYDPIVSPGIVCVLNIAPELGVDRPAAIMAWDKPSRSLTGLNRRRDGTRRTNEIAYYVGRSGVTPGPNDDATSIAKFGIYYESMNIINGSSEQTHAEGLRQLSLRSFGEVTYRASPASARSPVALLDYEPGDTVPVYASSNFREELAQTLRVMEIPIDISDNAEEEVRGMTLATIPTVES